MTPERWKRIDEIFEAASERAPSERGAFLDGACAGDEELRREVESLLAHQQETGGFLPTLFYDAAKLLGRPPGRAGDAGENGDAAEDDGGGFIPGTLIEERYRVVGPVGRGGMGEVYRADDLKLRQPVALKFLPERLSRDSSMLERFRGEVRTARRVSHPNVCRVFDIGETGGRHFISMEYIDGEDLSSLLRRIGRLPEDKATEVARQLCAGLSAAHEEGVLHRDLKPANVMIDGRGRARITDFGLAGLAGEFSKHDLGSGTPAYMAPEQLEGREVSARSDIYSLGLLLYEVFTGRRAFDAPSLDEMLRQRETSEPPSISSFVKDVDPVVERVIQRCLERDPAKRPDSALKVAAALPGGDPLAAALAAGETPSPEMVAATPKEGSLRPAVAAVLLLGIVAAVAFRCFGTAELFIHRVVPFEKSPEVLSDRAREVARSLGYTYAPADAERGFEYDYDYLNYSGERDRSPERWRAVAKGRPAALRFWYRQSPRPLVPAGGPRVTIDDPPATTAGMINVSLDTEGRLLAFDAAPPQVERPTDDAPPAPDWAALFSAAGLDMQGFTPAEPGRLPPHMSDARAAWEGHFPDAADIPLRVEAAAFRGRPVYFETIAPWTKALRDEPWDLTPARRRFAVALFAVFMTVLVTAVWFARRNVRLGRGDRRGASRIALLIFSLAMLGWIVSADHVASVVGELTLLWYGVATALMQASIVWVLYIALEPYVRRRRPELIISWSRLIAGDFRDPMVGRDILTGLFALTVGWNIITAWELVARRTGQPGYLFGVGGGSAFNGLAEVVGVYFLTRFSFMSLLHGFGYVFLLLMFSFFLRRKWMAGVGLWLLFILVNLAQGVPTPSELFFTALSAGIIAFVTARFGLLAMITCQFTYFMMNFYPYTSDFSAWYADVTVFALAVVLGLALYAFRTSLAGQPLLRGGFADD
jgi:hypothetical protein